MARSKFPIASFIVSRVNSSLKTMVPGIRSMLSQAMICKSARILLRVYTTVDGTEYDYLLRVVFQTRPLAWEVELVDVTYTNAERHAVVMPRVEEEP